MAKIRDRAEDFKDAIRREAVSLEFNESKMAAIMASFIIHRPRERTPFMKASLKTLESIGALEQFLMKHKKDYVDLHRTTEHERDSIEHEVTVFIKACQEQIDILKGGINDDEASSKGWLGIRTDGSNADTVAHKHGVVIILSEKLHSVTSEFDRLRAIRFQDARGPEEKETLSTIQIQQINLNQRIQRIWILMKLNPAPGESNSSFWMTKPVHFRWS